MFKSLIGGYSEKCIFNEPAGIEKIENTEIQLKTRFPNELRELLRESNGIKGEFEHGLLWTIEDILRINLEFRNDAHLKNIYMPFDSLLFFADAGNGDQFAYPIQNGEIKNADIFVWNHEDDSRSWVAPDILKYFEWWLTGQLKI